MGHESNHKSPLVWIDMEMSGLEAETNTILQIAVIITDNELNHLSEGLDVVVHQADSILDGMDEWNSKQHKRSGLTKRVRESKISLEEAGKIVLSHIKKYCKKGEAPLCGNSIGHDRTFINKYLPELEDYLHYRIIDVSTVKELVKRWYPKKVKLPKKKTNHLALDDIEESIEELLYYKKNFISPTQ